ncbi:hypothetical protein NDU88_011123 [Pleurodeles waltl]|uniref:Uncharacterized protein n=1 Tax=Pleurodeles waltl TaxID=8319 RepID=A0AAV7S5B8_PLEWA|nr:hypothetical protein NDU88_011123 [Pleurodeles waltl]
MPPPPRGAGCLAISGTAKAALVAYSDARLTAARTPPPRGRWAWALPAPLAGADCLSRPAAAGVKKTIEGNGTV